MLRNAVGMSWYGLYLTQYPRDDAIPAEGCISTVVNSLDQGMLVREGGCRVVREEATQIYREPTRSLGVHSTACPACKDVGNELPISASVSPH